MSLNVSQRGRTIATFRYVEVRLMEIAAEWTPTTPEMEVKVLLGRHIWDFAKHADALGRRTLELRLSEQASLAPASTYLQALDEMGRLEETAERLGVLYDAFLPDLERRYRRYLTETHALLDAPSVEIVEWILGDEARQRQQAGSLRRELGLPEAAAPLIGLSDGDSLAALVALEERT